MNSDISLNGVWEIYIDEAGATLQYSGYPEVLDAVPWDRIEVPGCWEAKGISKTFTGPVWYRRSFLLPSLKGDDRHWLLRFDAVSYYCEVFVNGKLAGCHEGLWDGFHMDITGMLVPEGENVIAVKVFKPGYEADDRFPFRETLTGFIPDVASTFGGIWGNTSIEEKPAVYIENAFIEPILKESCARVNLSLYNSLRDRIEIDVKVSLQLPGGGITESSVKLQLSPGVSDNETLNLKIANPVLWDLDNPYLYTAELTVEVNGKAVDCSVRRFGMREIQTEGSKILLNGNPVYLRGILHWGHYPDMICPNPDRDTIADEIRKAKNMGFNMIKHCLYIPRDEYYRVADEMGMLLWQELPVWLPKVTPEFKDRMLTQYPRIIRQLAGHPSLILYTLGCEMDAGVDGELLDELFGLTRQMAGNVLIKDNSGSGECYEGLAVDYADFYDYHFYSDLNNIENLMEVFTAGWRERRPWVFGEFCDSDTYRDTRELKQNLKESELWWLSDKVEDNPLQKITKMPVIEQEKILYENNIENDSELLKEISLKQSLLHRKFTIESTRRFPEITGYVVTCIRDVPITTSGIFDDNMKQKFAPEDFRTFNNDVMLLPAWDLKRIWANGGDRVFNRDRYNFWCGENAGIHILLSHYGVNTLKRASVFWEVTDSRGGLVFKGLQEVQREFQPGSVGELATLRFKTPDLDKAEALSVNVSANCDGIIVKNEWKLWVYPKRLLNTDKKKIALFDPTGILKPLEDMYSLYKLHETPQDIDADAVITAQITLPIEKYLLNGGKVFYIQKGEDYLPSEGCPFWREAVKRIYDHEILCGFPHEGFTDLQFFGLSTDRAIDTLRFKHAGVKEINPIIRRVDARKFKVSDYMVEIVMGQGRLIASTLRFEGGMGKQPYALDCNTAGVYLIDRVLRYLTK